MNELQIALAQFRKSIPDQNPVNPTTRARTDEVIESVLRSQVLPVVVDLLKRPSFQTLVNWTFDTWLTEVESPEALTLTATVTSLRALATSIAEFLELNREKLTPVLTTGSPLMLTPVVITGDSIFSVPKKAKKPTRATAAKGSPQLTTLPAEKSAWADFLIEARGSLSRLERPLVSATDFFNSTFERSVVIDDRSKSRAKVTRDANRKFVFATSWSTLTPGVDKEILLAGNMITTCLLARIDAIHSHLSGLLQRINIALVKLKDRRSPWSESKREADRNCQELRRLCLHSPTANLSDAATMLVRIAVGYSASDLVLDWLPPDVRSLAKTRDVKIAMRYPYDVLFPNKLALALERVASWMASLPSVQNEIDEAIKAKDLVVLVGSQEVYWKGQKVPRNWNSQKTSWDFMLALARSRGLRIINADDLVVEGELSENALKQRRHKWGQGLPKELRSAVVAVKGKDGGYRLQLSESQIAIFE